MFDAIVLMHAKRIFAIVVFAVFTIQALGVEFAGGTGEANDPYQIATAEQWVAIEAGGSFSLALTADGSIRAWGMDDWEQLAVPLGQGFIEISAGHFHALGIRQVRP